VPDEREMVDAVWVTARDAVRGFDNGRLPMVFPTIKTIQRLLDYRTVDEMLAVFRGAEVLPILPRLIRTREGVQILMDEKGELQE
jgi:recombination protein RecT